MPVMNIAALQQELETLPLDMQRAAVQGDAAALTAMQARKAVLPCLLANALLAQAEGLQEAYDARRHVATLTRANTVSLIRSLEVQAAELRELLPNMEGQEHQAINDAQAVRQTLARLRELLPETSEPRPDLARELAFIATRLAEHAGHLPTAEQIGTEEKETV